MHADAERAAHGRVGSVQAAQPFGGSGVAAPPGFITGAAAHLARHLVGDAGRKPVAHVPADAEKLEADSVPPALADGLLGGKEPDQQKWQHAAQVNLLKAPHGFRKTRGCKQSGNNFSAAALLGRRVGTGILIEQSESNSGGIGADPRASAAFAGINGRQPGRNGNRRKRRLAGKPLITVHAEQVSLGLRNKGQRAHLKSLLANLCLRILVRESWFVNFGSLVLSPPKALKASCISLSALLGVSYCGNCQFF